MRILVLSQKGSPVSEIIKKNGDEILEFSDLIDVSFLEKNKVDMIVSHGYRHLIKLPIIKYLPDRILNLHISFLPWNKGADPNLWSFLENTSKGVSIHFIDRGIDTGDIIAQKEIYFSGENETLATTYEKLQDEINTLFEKIWPQIRVGKNHPITQQGVGTLHKSADKKKFEHLLINGWNTRINLLIGKALQESD